MNDYSTAIFALVAITGALTAGVIFILKQPSDLPAVKHQRH